MLHRGDDDGAAVRHAVLRAIRQTSGSAAPDLAPYGMPPGVMHACLCAQGAMTQMSSIIPQTWLGAMPICAISNKTAILGRSSTTPICLRCRASSSGTRQLTNRPAPRVYRKSTPHAPASSRLPNPFPEPPPPASLHPQRSTPLHPTRSTPPPSS